ncbi:MAG: hypothetical protein QXK72_04365 [Candidatus Bathyarchaeia archaeon]
MPLLENDVIFAFLNDYDPNRTVSEEVFRKMQGGELTVELSSVSLVEMGLIYRGEGFEDASRRLGGDCYLAQCGIRCVEA